MAHRPNSAHHLFLYGLHANNDFYVFGGLNYKNNILPSKLNEILILVTSFIGLWYARCLLSITALLL